MPNLGKAACPSSLSLSYTPGAVGAYSLSRGGLVPSVHVGGWVGET